MIIVTEFVYMYIWYVYKTILNIEFTDIFLNTSKHQVPSSSIL